MELDNLNRMLKAYTFFGATPPDIDSDTLIEFVRQGLSEITGKTSGKDSIIGGIRLLGELRIIKAEETLLIALKDNNKSVRREALKVLEKFDINPPIEFLMEKERLDREWNDRHRK